MNEAKNTDLDLMIDELRLLDDYFMTIVFDENYPATELILKVILTGDDITLKKVRVQKQMRNPEIKGKSIIFDIFSEDDEGNLYDVEVQRDKRGAEKRRSRFYSGVMDSRILKSGQDFSEMKDSYEVFITETDVMKGGLPIYHINRVIDETSEKFEDGNHIIYVNGAYRDDGTPIGKLIHDFRCKKADDMYYTELREAVRYYKESKVGREKMSGILEQYRKKWIEEGRLEGKLEGKLEGREEEKKSNVRKLLSAGIDIETISKALEISADEIKMWRMH